FVKRFNAIGKGRIRANLGQTQVRNLRQQQARVLLALLPKVRIEIAKHVGTVGRPAPPVVPGKNFKWLQGRRQLSGRRAGHEFIVSFWGHSRISVHKSKAAEAPPKRICDFAETAQPRQPAGVSAARPSVRATFQPELPCLTVGLLTLVTELLVL